MAELSTDELLGFIATNPMVLPLKEDMETLANDMYEEAPLLALMPATIIDNRLHAAEHAFSQKEKQKHSMLEVFKDTLKREKVPLIDAIIYNGCRAKK